MFEPNDILNSHAQRQSAVADSADTTITVNNQGGRAPAARPEFRTYQHTVDTTRTPVAPLTPRPAGPSRVVTETHREINWGGVAKGVAIVAGVALVGVVAFTAAPALLTSLGVIGEGGLLTGVINGAAPLVTTLGNGLIYGAHFAETLGVMAFEALGGPALWAWMTGGVSAAATTVSTSAISVGTGALAAGGAVAMAVPMAAKAMIATPMAELAHTTHTVTPTLTGLEDGGAAAHSSHSTTTTTVAAHPQPGHNAHRAHDAMDLPDMPDEHLIHDQTATMKAASKVAHHAAHEVEGHGSAHESHRDALRSTARTSEAWADRVGHRQTHEITPRSSQFAEQVAEDRAQLDAALHAGRA